MKPSLDSQVPRDHGFATPVNIVFHKYLYMVHFFLSCNITWGQPELEVKNWP